MSEKPFSLISFDERRPAVLDDHAVLHDVRRVDGQRLENPRAECVMISSDP